MERIGIRELRQHASRYVERVKAGESVEVTERGRLVALLVPPGAARTTRDRLVASGRLIPGSGPSALPRRVPLPVGSPSTDDVLADLRDDG